MSTRCRLPGILVFIVIATLSLNAAVFLTVTEERAAAAQIARMAPAAEAVLAEMEALLIAHAQARAGALSNDDMVLLNAAVASLRHAAASGAVAFGFAATRRLT